MMIVINQVICYGYRTIHHLFDVGDNDDLVTTISDAAVDSESIEEGGYDQIN